MPLLDKVTECDMFSLNVSSEGCLLHLNGLKGSMRPLGEAGEEVVQVAPTIHHPAKNIDWLGSKEWFV